MRKHIREIHEKRRNPKCSKCPKELTTKWHLTQHVEGIHEKIRDYKCSECLYQFSTVCQLTSHIKFVHKGIKDYQCKECSKPLNTSAQLRYQLKEQNNNAGSNNDGPRIVPLSKSEMANGSSGDSPRRPKLFECPH